MPAYSLGNYPTPVRRIDGLSTEFAELWIKDDGVSHPSYGGNKLRKLEFLLPEAARRGARRLVVLGAAGSHQVLATAWFGKSQGFSTLAVVCPQLWSEHAETTLRTALALGVQAVPAASVAAFPIALARAARRGDYVIAPGGAGTLGTLGYLVAVRELVEQIRFGQLPEPDLIVVPVASGGTAGGILAGVLREGLASRVLGILVADPPRLPSQALVLAQAWAATRRDRGPAGPIELSGRLLIDDRFRGGGYTWPTPAGEAALRSGRAHGIRLESTYTAKTFAAALELAAGRRLPVLARERPARLLYWHTFSARAPEVRPLPALPPELDRLFIGPRSAAATHGVGSDAHDVFP